MESVQIDGKAVAKRIHEQIASEVELMVTNGQRSPHLAVVLVGSDPASQVYVRTKTSRAKKAGMQVTDVALDSTVSEDTLHETLHDLSADPTVDGILLQLPLPSHLDEFAALSHIDPTKDVDGLHPFSQGLLFRGAKGFKPCTPKGCMLLLEDALLSLGRSSDMSGLHAVVVGRSVLVGKPMAAMLLEANCTVTVCHSKTRDLVEQCQQADILIAAVGQPEIFTAAHVKEGAIVIDVGINRKDDGTLVGDCDFESCSENAAAITPVPGGVGPMTIAVLLQNTVQAAQLRNG